MSIWEWLIFINQKYFEDDFCVVLSNLYLITKLFIIIWLNFDQNHLPTLNQMLSNV